MGAAVAVVGLVFTITGPVVVEPQTDPDHFSVEALGNDGVTQFILPVDARLEQMPYEINPGCSPSMLEWLSRMGEERPTSYLMTIRNDADDGPMLTVSNVRVEDKKRLEPEPSILFNCPDAGLGETATLNLDLDRSSPAVLLDTESRSERPFSFNLQPGEEGSIDLRLLAVEDGYSGQVVADVSGRGSTQPVPLDLGGDSGDFIRPGLGNVASQLVVEPGSEAGLFYCIQNDSSGNPATLDACTADDVRSIARGSSDGGDEATPKVPAGVPAFSVQLGGDRNLVGYRVADPGGRYHVELAHLDGPDVLAVLADPFKTPEGDYEWPGSARCGPEATLPSYCVVTFEVGAHGAIAIVVRVAQDSIELIDQDPIGVGTPTAVPIDLNSDGVPDLAAQNPLGVYAEGARYWETWENVDGRLVHTGCSEAVPIDPPIMPTGLHEGPCPI